MPNDKTYPHRSWPWPDITPMHAHAPSGQWRRRYKGKDYYFGILADPRGALETWRREWPGIAGERPTAPQPAGVRSKLTIRELCNLFLDARLAQVNRKELRWPTFDKYKGYCGRLIHYLGEHRRVADLAPGDFIELLNTAGKRLGVHSRSDFVSFVKRVFAWGEDAELYPHVRIPKEFRKPRRATVIEHKQRVGAEVFSAADVHRLLAAADPQMRAMIMLGVNAGFGNNDLSELRVSEVDLERRVIESPRAKTRMTRTVPLWPETVEALRVIIDPDAGRVFRTPKDRPVVRRWTNTVGREFKPLAKRAKVRGTFRWFRNTFATEAENVPGGEEAAHRIMGHSTRGVHAEYVHRLPLDRLAQVSNHVRDWFLAAAESPGRTASAPSFAATASAPASPSGRVGSSHRPAPRARPGRAYSGRGSTASARPRARRPAGQ